MMMTKKVVLSWASAMALLTVPMTAVALEEGECESSADCSEGAVCEKAQWVNGCDPQGASDDGGDGSAPAPLEPDRPEASDDLSDSGSDPAPVPPECDTTVHEAEIGRCVVPPTPCTADAECGEYERCNKVSGGATCGASSDDVGDGVSDGGWSPTDCEETPEPEEQMGTCGPGSSSCESNDDCPREFECVVTSGGFDDGCACVTEPCNCDTIATETKSCLPKKIECDTDSECPADWACQGTESMTCSGGGGSSEGTSDDLGDGSSDPGEGIPTPTSDDSDTSGSGSDRAPKEECTTVQQKGSCLPKAWSVYDATPGAGGPRDDGVVGNEGNDDLGSSGGGDDSPPPDKDGGDPGEGAPTSGDDGSGEESANGSTSKGGCSVGPRMTAPSPGLWVFGIAMMGVLVRRRRRAA